MTLPQGKRSRSVGDQSSARSRNAAGASVFLLLFTAAAVLFVVLDRPFLPENYAYDEQKIQAIARGDITVTNDQSFQRVGDIYAALGLAERPILAALLGFFLFIVVMVIAFRNGRLARISPGDVTVCAGIFALAAIYLGHYSKDVFVLPVVLLVIVGIDRVGKGMDLTALAGILVYAYFMRSYWFVVAGFFLMFRWTLGRRRPVLYSLVAAVLGLLILAVLFDGTLGISLDSYRIRVNDGRSGSVYAANTEIVQLFSSSSPVLAVVNCLFVLLTFFVPYPLLLSGKMQHVVASVFLAFLWIRLLFALAYARRAGEGRPIPEGLGRGLAVVIAVLVTQSIFEPDYGSFIRHLTPLMPLVAAIILQCQIGSTAARSITGEGMRVSEEECEA